MNPFSDKIFEYDDVEKNHNKTWEVRKNIIQSLREIEVLKSEGFNIEVKFYPSSLEAKATFRLFFANDDVVFISYYMKARDSNQRPEIVIRNKRENNFFHPFSTLFDYFWENGEKGTYSKNYLQLSVSNLSNEVVINDIKLKLNLFLDLDLNLSENVNRACVVAVSGKDSMAAIIDTINKNIYRIIVPVVVVVPAEIDDWHLSLDTLSMVRKYCDKQYSSSNTITQMTPAIVLEDDSHVWENVNSSSLNIYSEYSLPPNPCIGCHIYIHGVRSHLSKALGITNVVSGDREKHKEKVKLNQSKLVLDYIIKFIKDKYDVNLLFPFRHIVDCQEIWGILNKEGIKRTKVHDIRCHYSKKEENQYSVDENLEQNLTELTKNLIEKYKITIDDAGKN